MMTRARRHRLPHCYIHVIIASLVAGDSWSTYLGFAARFSFFSLFYTCLGTLVNRSPEPLQENLEAYLVKCGARVHLAVLCAQTGFLVIVFASAISSPNLFYWFYVTFKNFTVAKSAIVANMYEQEALNPIPDALEDFIFIFRQLIAAYLDIGEDMNVPDDFTQKEMQTGMWWRHLAAGGIAGAVSRTCTAPLDRLKVFLQVQSSKQTIKDCFTNMLKEGGVQGLWRGNGINVLKIAPESAIKFAAYEQVKRTIKGDSKQALTIYERFFAGAMAGGISQTAIYPLEVLKTRLALRKTGQFKGIADAAFKIYSKEGLLSFYRGYVPNILGIIPYAGIDLAVYETLKKKYLQRHSTCNEHPSFYLLLACGSASSTLGQMCSYPLALVRTRLQAQAITDMAVDRSSNSMTGVFKNILQKEGFVGLYRGITPNFIKVMPAVSISYVVYEYSSRILGVNMT